MRRNRTKCENVQTKVPRATITQYNCKEKITMLLILFVFNNTLKSHNEEEINELKKFLMSLNWHNLLIVVFVALSVLLEIYFSNSL